MQFLEYCIYPILYDVYQVYLMVMCVHDAEYCKLLMLPAEMRLVVCVCVTVLDLISGVRYKHLCITSPCSSNVKLDRDGLNSQKSLYMFTNNPLVILIIVLVPGK